MVIGLLTLLALPATAVSGLILSRREAYRQAWLDDMSCVALDGTAWPRREPEVQPQRTASSRRPKLSSNNIHRKPRRLRTEVALG
jgi:hypothetical protein